jgi:prepilin-type N-terminal cleavage/methylation domain-containing protein
MHRPRSQQGFTLVELMVAMSLATIVIAGVLSAYTFLGRNLAKLVNQQQLQVKSQTAQQFLAKDVATATAVSTASASTCTLRFASAPDITYTYNSGTGKLTRDGIAVLSDLTAFSFAYYKNSGATTTSAPDVKMVEMTYTATLGASAAGTYVSAQYASPRLLMRNKVLLQ